MRAAPGWVQFVGACPVPGTLSELGSVNASSLEPADGPAWMDAPPSPALAAGPGELGVLSSLVFSVEMCFKNT